MKQLTYCVSRQFDIAGPASFRMDRHYFVYALSGVMRLEADGRRWTLPPARGALIAARHPVEITILSPVAAASVLFETEAMTPKANLVVFEISPLCRELVRVCRQWGAGDLQDDYAVQIFGTLAAEIARLARSPSLCYLNKPKDAALGQALALIEDRLAEDLELDDVARSVGRSSRTLARRFTDELGMTWRETLRRVRIIRATELLALSQMSVTEVAFAVGYASLSGFSAAFQDIVERTPSDYRKSLFD